MPTVRSPNSLAARKIRMAISLRLAASSFWMFLVFVIKAHHGHEIETHDKLYIFTRAAAMPQEFFKCGEATNVFGRRRFSSECSRDSLRAHRLRGRGLPLLHLSHDFAPLFRLALGGIGSVGVREKVQ